MNAPGGGDRVIGLLRASQLFCALGGVLGLGLFVYELLASETRGFPTMGLLLFANAAILLAVTQLLVVKRRRS